MAKTKTDVLDNEAQDQTGWSREQVAQSLIQRHSAVGAAAGFVPIPGGDVFGISASALNMIKRLSDLYEVPFTRQAALNVIMTLASGAAPMALKATAASMLKAVPGVGTFAGTAAMPVLGGASVYAIGQVMVKHFESGGDLLNIDARQAKEYFRAELEKQRHGKAATGKAAAAS